MYSVWQKTGGGVSVSGSVRTVNELIVSKCAKYRVHKRDFFWQVSFELFWPHVIRLLTKYLRYLKLHSYIETSTNLDRPEKSVETDAHVIDVIEQWILRVLTYKLWMDFGNFLYLLYHVIILFSACFTKDLVPNWIMFLFCWCTYSRLCFLYHIDLQRHSYTW